MDVQKKLIFLISLPRSGSTLLQRMLATHKDIHTTSETWLMLHPLHALKPSELNAKYDHTLAVGALSDYLSNIPEGRDLYYNAVRSYGLTFYSRVLEISRKRYFLDKTPRYYRIIPELRRTFPNARFIILIRNPLDILSSVLKTWCRNDISVLLRSSNYNDIMEGPQMLVDGIRRRDDNLSIVRYEDLVTSPSETIQMLCDFLGIDFFKGMLNYGAHSVPKGRFGDPVGIHQYDRPVQHSLDKWRRNLSDPTLLRFAHNYLQSIGEQTIGKLGYDYWKLLSIAACHQNFKHVDNIGTSIRDSKYSILNRPLEADAALADYREFEKSVTTEGRHTGNNSIGHRTLKEPIIIYQMGKVGPTSLMESLNRIGIPNQHVHRLSWQGIAQAEKRFRDQRIDQIPDRLKRYRELRNYIEHRKHSNRWKIITLVRDPLARQISCVFQNLSTLLPSVLQINDTAKQYNIIENYMTQYLSAFQEPEDDACQWFDNELKNVFGFDIFSTPFDKMRGYKIYKVKNADILAIRIEQLSKCVSCAMNEFLGIENFRLVNANVSIEKPYFKLYELFRSQFKANEDLLDRIYDTRLSRHFYTSEEIFNFKKKWIRSESPMTEKVKRSEYRVSAIVSVYASERFIEGRLKNLIDQTLFKKGQLEIIIVDSNSPENEKAIVDEFIARYPDIIYHRTAKRETVYAAWNRGIQMIHGTYFVNANTDDRFAPDALEAMADALDSQPEYDAVYGNWIITQTPNDTFGSMTLKRQFIYPEFNPGLFFYLQITSHANFIRRSVFEKIGSFDGRYIVFGDREFMFRFSSAGYKALKLEKIVGLYLENPNSVERANNDTGRQECSTLYGHYLAPERFAKLMGHDAKEVSAQVLSEEYTRIGCLGIGLYDCDGNPMHALGTPVQMFTRAIEISPENIIALNNMGIIAQYLNKSQVALDFLNKAKTLANSIQAGVIDVNLKRIHQCISDPNQLQFLMPSDFNPIRVSISKYKATENIFEQSIWRDYLHERYSAVFSSVLLWLSDHPEHWDAYTLLVDVMLQSGQAMAIPDQLRPLEGRSALPAKMQALVGSGYEAAGDLQRAAEFADHALAVDAGCGRAWNLKGVLAYRHENGEQATEHFKKAAQLDADWGEPWTNLGSIHWEHQDRDNALDCFERGFTLSPIAPNVATTYHAAVTAMGNYARAKPVFEDVVQRHPEYRKVRFLLIDILIQMEACQAALDHIEHVIMQFGTDPQMFEAAKAVRAKVGPMKIKKTNRPSLSLCMIVKDEAQYLPRCLESLKPIVDEMIIVDTGSSDATRDIAEIFGAQVFDFEWNDDFAAARNVSLDKASGDWILIMDADEVIAKKDHKIFKELLKNSTKDQSYAFVMTTRNYMDRQDCGDYSANTGEYEEEQSTGWVPTRKVRLFRNNKGAHFVFPVHEQVDPVLAQMGIPLDDCPIPVHHFGKLDRARTAIRGQLYYSIGKAKLASNTNDDNALKELAIQAGLLAKWKEAATCWKQYLKHQPNSLEACLNLTRVMAQDKNFAAANTYARKAYQLSQDRYDVIYNLSLSELQTGQAEQAGKTAAQLTALFPDDIDGQLLKAIADMAAGDLSAGFDRIQHLTQEYPNASLPSRSASIIGAVYAAGFKDQVITIVSELSKIDGLAILESKFAEPPVTESQTEIPHASPVSPEMVVALYEGAGLEYQKEDYCAALASLSQVIASKPDHWEAYALLVDVMLQSGQEAVIVDQLRPLEGCADLPAKMLALIGSGYEAAGDLQRAAEFADRALVLDAGCGHAWNLKGVLAYREKNMEQAPAHFKTAAQHDADWGEPWTNLGSIHWERQEHDNALDCFEKGFTLSPVAPNVATTYHAATTEMGLYERAQSVFADVVRRHPNYRKAHYLLIDILIQLEAYPAALDRIEQMIMHFGPDSQMLEAAKAVRGKIGPMTIKKAKRPSLSLCMIVKDEEKCLPRCLASLKPIVDEMIIVDTGSSDATRDIAEIFGAHVFDFEWNDDFAAARNVSLDKASGDWILIMDADEVIAKKDHAPLRSCMRKYTKSKKAFLITTRNYTYNYNAIGWEENDGDYRDLEAGCGWIPSTKARMFKNTLKIRFEFPVHELVEPSLERNGYALKPCVAPVHHYGFLDRQRTNQKGQNYHKIGKNKLTRFKNEPKAIHELAVQANLIGDHKEAINLWHQLAQLQPQNVRVYINLSATYGMIGDYQNAKLAAQKSIQFDSATKEGHLNLGRSELLLGNFSEAGKLFQKIVRLAPNYHAARFMLGAAQICCGFSEKGSATIKKLDHLRIWKTLPHAFEELADTLTQAGFGKNAQDLMNSATKLNLIGPIRLEDRTNKGRHAPQNERGLRSMAS